jgi:hypothetical protein
VVLRAPLTEGEGFYDVELDTKDGL